jgi:23S rRNA pseudouridine1911/1915/1917 synthase
MSNFALYEDNHIIIINKKPSEIVQGDKSGDTPLLDNVKDYIKAKYNKPGNVFLGLVHRIDRPVSGIVIFARTSKSLSRLNSMLKEKQIKKYYWAVVKNLPLKPTGHLKHFLRRDRKQNKSYAYDKEVKGSKYAELKYYILSNSDNFYLLEIELITGRHHQIRAQLSAIGCPIKGDLKYGFPRSNDNASIHLHSRKVEFIHPVSKELISITAEPPDDPLWNYFSGSLPVNK